ncbi:hypothetical protein M1C57_24035 (plasmid) [Rhodococcus pyridinivorans]|uniref:hypothetical protein n=1 Tax=Rhodococcus pyridinivorans TaxID=103816 RepID=UPI00200AE594|nr:hypothetical protein [Rhodococcus pyridinivorans]UPW06958.1 hypothetical protein M1C57_24035 [Rhodococcus pyridinivorans]
MTRSGPNPVLAPIRRWVLYSRTNLAISVGSSLAVLWLVGMIFGEDPQPRSVDSTAIEAVESAQPTKAIEYNLDEVTESVVVAKSASWVASSAPATAMAYAHVFVDTALSDAEWTRALSRYTVDTPGPATVAARPRTPIVITGPTTSTSVIGDSEVPAAQVSVPTQAGDLLVSVVVEELSDGTQQWAVTTPLPTLELSKVEDATGPATTTPTPRTSTDDDASALPTPTTKSSPPSPTTTSEPTLDRDDSEVTPSRTVDPTPVPVPGPIPIPELDTPIPGQL